MKKNQIYTSLLGAALVSALSSCGVFQTDTLVDPNNLSVSSFINNPTKGQVDLLAIGVQAAMRFGYADMIQSSGAIGREVIYSASTDNRYYTEILGTAADAYGGATDPNGIFNGYFLSFTSTRRRAESFSMAAQSSAALNVAEKAAAKGFARTVQGWSMINLLNMQYKNGIRSGYADLSAPGDQLKPLKFVADYNAGLDLIIATLNEGATSLDAGGTAFPFTFAAGWTGFTTPATMKQVNRAFAARAYMYKQDWAAMNTAVNQSFLNLTGNLAIGPEFNYQNAQNDGPNGFFQNPDGNGAPLVLFEEVITSAEAGDTRVASKTRKRTTPRSSGATISSNYELKLYAANSSPIDIIRNEELVLMSAEAKAQTGDLAGATAAVNVIRTSAGLKSYAGAATKDGLIADILKQRRYSLLFEGHRWFDARRYNLLASLPFSTSPFKVFDSMVRPNAETQWELANPQ